MKKLSTTEWQIFIEIYGFVSPKVTIKNWAKGARVGCNLLEIDPLALLFGQNKRFALISEIPQSKDTEDDTTPTNSISSQGSQHDLEISQPVNNLDSKDPVLDPGSRKAVLYPDNSPDTVDVGQEIEIRVRSYYYYNIFFLLHNSYLYCC